MLADVLQFVKTVSDYYIDNGFRGLMYAAGSKFVRSKSISAVEISKKDAITWGYGMETEVKISNPENKRLNTEFSGYPSQFQSKISRVFELTNCTLVGKNAAGVYKQMNLRCNACA